MTGGSRLATLSAWPAERNWPWFIAGALLFLSFGFTEMMGSDLWWHMAAGREIPQQGSLWLLDDWSYTELGSAWHNHEWLADLGFYGWVTLLGVPSLVYWKWALMLATFGLLQRVLTRLSGNAPAAMIAAVAAAAIAAPFLDMRPQLYTLLGIAVLLNLTLQRSPRLWELLLLFLLWVNLHGGFIFGLMLLGILLFPWYTPGWASFKKAALTWTACALVCLVNPDGLRVFWLPLVYAVNADSPYRSLGEWRSPFEAGGIRSSLYAYSLIAGAAMALGWMLPTLRRSVRFSPELLVIAMLTAAMSATSRRFIILWAMAFALLLAPFLAALLRQRLFRPILLPLLLAGILVGYARVQPYSLRPAVAFHYLTAEYAFPHGLADFVEANSLGGKAFAYYNWGGYLHWRRDGDLKVFIDGRANTLFDDQVYLQYVTVLTERAGWLELLEGSGAELFLWPRARGGERLIRTLLQTGRWVLLYQDVRGVLLAKRDMPLPATLRRPTHSVNTQLTRAFLAIRGGDNATALGAARRAYEAQPWHQAACSWYKRALQANGQAREAEAVIERCRGWFPSRYLR